MGKRLNQLWVLVNSGGNKLSKVRRFASSSCHGGGGGEGLNLSIQNELTLLEKKSTIKLFGCLFFEKRRFWEVKSGPRSGSRPWISKSLLSFENQHFNATGLRAHSPIVSLATETAPSERNHSAPIFTFSKIQLVVYYQCCVLIGWAAARLYVIAH